MAIIMRVDENDFIRAFYDYNRAEQFGVRPGLRALYEYMDELSEEGDIELDVIAICCDYSQYDSALEAAKEMSRFEADEREEDEDEDDYAERMENEALDYLRDNTAVIEYDGGVIVQKF